jgi:hypothetical protein
MSDEYEFYQGVVLRQLVVNTDLFVMLRPYEKQGRINAFIVNGKIGIFIKHSAKRMSPWSFTFTLEQVSDLLDLTTDYPDTFVIFVCDDDGIVTLKVSDFYAIVNLQDTDKAWIRIERPPRTQYAVSGNRAELPFKVPTGILQVLETLRERARSARAS